LQLNILHNQAQALKQLKSASAITKITFHHEVLTIYYWQNPDNNGVAPISTAQASLSSKGAPLAFLRIQVDKNSLILTHSPELRQPGSREHMKLLVRTLNY